MEEMAVPMGYELMSTADDVDIFAFDSVLSAVDRIKVELSTETIMEFPNIPLGLTAAITVTSQQPILCLVFLNGAW
jgi:hypothetical protein